MKQKQPTSTTKKCKKCKSELYNTTESLEKNKNKKSGIWIPDGEKHTFHVERGGACHLSMVILDFTAVDTGILGEDLEQQQCVLISIMEELALVAGGQSLGVFVPRHLRLRDAAHLHREAN